MNACYLCFGELMAPNRTENRYYHWNGRVFVFQPDLDLTACIRCTKKTKESSNDAAVPLSSSNNQTEDVNT